MMSQSPTALEEPMPMLIPSHRYPKGPNPYIIIMNKELYYRIISYLGQQKMPPHLEEWTKTIINQTWKQFETDREILKKGQQLGIPEY